MTSTKPKAKKSKSRANRYKQKSNPTSLPENRSISVLWNKKYQSFFIFSGIILVICLLYFPVLHAPFVFDDHSSIVDNSAVHSLELKKIYAFAPFRFLGYLSFAGNYYFSSLDTFSYHLINIVVHILFVVFSFFFIKTLWQTPSGMAIPLSSREKYYVNLAVALVLAVHPLSTFAVSYIVQRLAAMTAVFYVGTLFFYLKTRLAQNIGKRIFLSLFFITFLLCGLFTKQNFFSIFPQLFFLELLCFDLTSGRRKAFFFCIPAVLAGMFFFLYFQFIDLNEIRRFTIETSLITRKEYLFTQFSVLCFYLKSFFVPVNLALDYPSHIHRFFFLPKVVVPALILCGIFAAAVLAAARKKTRLAAYGIVFYFTAISIESSIIPIKDTIFLHRTYLPNLGLAFAFFVLVYTLLKKWKPKPGILFSVFSIWVVALIGFTIHTNLIFQSPLKIWERVLKVSPECLRGYINVSDQYLDSKDYYKTIEICNRAISINRGSAKIYNNRGLACKALQNYDNAVSDLNKAIELDPEYADAYNNLGTVFYLKQKYDKAIEYYSKAISMDLKNAHYYNNRGVAYKKKKKYSKAIADYTNAVQLNPKFDDAYHNRGLLYFENKIYKNAIEDFTYAIRINPLSAKSHYDRGIVFSNKNEHAKALSDYTRAVEIDPEYARAYHNRAITFYYLKKYDKSFSDVQKVLSLGGKVDPVLLQQLKMQR